MLPMKLLQALLIFSIVCCSCNKAENTPVPPGGPVKDSVADILNYTIDGMQPVITVSPGLVDVRFADTVTDPENLVASFSLTEGASASINGVAQVSGKTANNYNNYLNYSVKNKSGVIKHWIVSATNNDYTAKWGLGRFIKESGSNDRLYNWYFTQAGTGEYWNINCGPACVTMAMKWADSSFNLAPADARAYFPQNTGLWGFGTIGEYLREHDFDHSYVNLGGTAEETFNIIKKQIDSGRIGILLITTEKLGGFIGVSGDPYADRYYPENFNHFVVVYGYKKVDDEIFFQVNDPWNVALTHADGSLKGKNRYYRYGDIYNAAAGIENGMCVIYAKQ